MQPNTTIKHIHRILDKQLSYGDKFFKFFIELNFAVMPYRSKCADLRACVQQTLSVAGSGASTTSPTSSSSTVYDGSIFKATPLPLLRL
eukprot:6479151-Amphidinium_carterae.2